MVAEIVFGLAGLAMMYGMADHQGRANLKSWIGGHVAPVKRHTPKILFRSLFLLLFAGSGAITWSSVKEIYEFLTSLAPMARKDVFMLIVNIFNALAYGSASFACFMLTFGKHPEKRLPLVLAENKPVSFRLQGSTGAEALKKALHEGITVTVSIDSKRQVHIEADNLDGISLSQLPATPSSSTTIKD